MPPKPEKPSCDLPSPAELARLVMAELESNGGFMKKFMEDAVQKAMAWYANRLEEQEGRVMELETKVNAQAAEIDMLKKAQSQYDDKLQRLETRIEAQEQHSRRNNLRIHGLDVAGSTDEAICALAGKLGFQIKPDEIDQSHYLGPAPKADMEQQESTRPRPIIVRFRSYKTRARFLEARSKLKGTNIYINEDLTARGQKLFYSVRHAKKIPRAWTIDGRIYAGIKNSSGGFTKKLITCEADIAKLEV